MVSSWPPTIFSWIFEFSSWRLFSFFSFSCWSFMVSFWFWSALLIAPSISSLSFFFWPVLNFSLLSVCWSVWFSFKFCFSELSFFSPVSYAFCWISLSDFSVLLANFSFSFSFPFFSFRSIKSSNFPSFIPFLGSSFCWSLDLGECICSLSMFSCCIWKPWGETLFTWGPGEFSCSLFWLIKFCSLSLLTCLFSLIFNCSSLKLAVLKFCILGFPSFWSFCFSIFSSFIFAISSSVLVFFGFSVWIFSILFVSSFPFPFKFWRSSSCHIFCFNFSSCHSFLRSCCSFFLSCSSFCLSSNRSCLSLSLSSWRCFRSSFSLSRSLSISFFSSAIPSLFPPCPSLSKLAASFCSLLKPSLLLLFSLASCCLFCL